MAIVKVDEKGRIVIPRSARKKIELKRDGYVKVVVEDKRIILEPLEPISEKFFGALKIDRWPEDLDEFVAEVVKKWWEKGT
jgi:AbrB family looped-hinge helix DNA binding protein